MATAARPHSPKLLTCFGRSSAYTRYPIRVTEIITFSLILLDLRNFNSKLGLRCRQVKI